MIGSFGRPKSLCETAKKIANTIIAEYARASTAIAARLSAAEKEYKEWRDDPVAVSKAK